MLKFNLDHALAKDAVHACWNYPRLIELCAQNNLDTLLTYTRATRRKDYLLNPTLGAYVRDDIVDLIISKKQVFDICLIVTDGLSAQAIEEHFWNFIFKFIPDFKSKYPQLTLSPINIAPFGRVALSDHLGELYQSKISIIFVGERPGLSSVNSMGIYCTQAPKVGLTNSDRHCISNIRPPFGLSYNCAIDELFKILPI